MSVDCIDMQRGAPQRMVGHVLYGTLCSREKTSADT